MMITISACVIIIVVPNALDIMRFSISAVVAVAALTDSVSAVIWMVEGILSVYALVVITEVFASITLNYLVSHWKRC